MARSLSRYSYVHVLFVHVGHSFHAFLHKQPFLPLTSTSSHALTPCTTPHHPTLVAQYIVSCLDPLHHHSPSHPHHTADASTTSRSTRSTGSLLSPYLQEQPAFSPLPSRARSVAGPSGEAGYSCSRRRRIPAALPYCRLELPLHNVGSWDGRLVLWCFPLHLNQEIE
jgi:hypothetical protein